jgi:NAD(P)-dependent dehydrogenase (short-subunit alcohol dehydrogenase family)
MSHSKQIALVTGANKGLGLETARQLSKKGVTVILSARNEEKGQAAVAQLRSEGVETDFIKLDVTDGEDIQHASAYIDTKYGKLDMLINNAGISKEKTASYAVNTSPVVEADIIKEVYETNVFGAIALTQVLLPLLEKSDSGRIINVSSELGSLALHADNTSPVYRLKKFSYNSSKTVLNQFTVHLAEALKDTHVRVNSVSPGWVKTDMGSQYAPLEIPDGAKIIVEVALAKDTPNGAFITHEARRIPW